MAMKQTQLGPGDAAGKKMKKKTPRCVKKQLPLEETRCFFFIAVHMWLCFVCVAKLGWAGLEADSHHRISHSAADPQGDEEEGGTFLVMTFLCVSNHYVCVLRPHSPGSSCTSAC